MNEFTEIIKNPTETIESSTEIEKTNEIEKIIETEGKIKEDCSIDEIKNNNCYGDITDEQIEQIYSYIKENLLNNENNNIIIKADNIIFQISSSEEQKYSDNPNISSIDLGQCETELKRKNNISESKSLIIFKTDIKSNDKSTTYVQYEIYNPETYHQLNLDICKDLTIDIYTPVSLDSTTSQLFSSLNDYGYNLFNQNDSFYNDICTPYTTQNGTDILLLDRKVDIYAQNGNKELCQDGCELQYYNETSKKAKCNCGIKPEENKLDLDKIFDFDKKEIEDNFLSTLSNSNFLVLKCFKLAFDTKNLFQNIGRIIMTILLLFIIILLILYCFTGNKQLTKYLKEIIKENFCKNNTKTNHKSNKSINEIKNNSLNKPSNKTLIFPLKNINNNQKDNKPEIKKSSKNLKKNIKNHSHRIQINSNNNLYNNHHNKEHTRNKKHQTHKINKKDSNESNENKSKNKHRISNKSKTIKHNIKKNIINDDISYPPKKKKIINHRKALMNGENSSTFQNIINSTYNEKIRKKNIQQNIIINNKIYNYKNSNESLIICKHKSSNHIANTAKNIIYNQKHYTDQELNSLEYEMALKIDKRTYFQYYWALLKKKHLILFTFLFQEDFNLISLKIVLFILSFSLYFTINGFFFSDDTMHKVYKDNGAFDILYQIPQILYSTIVSSVIKIILNQLSLSEKNILAIKHEKKREIAMDKSQKIKKCLRIKFILFFIISFLLMDFFWYFISTFCAVYVNTQKILIKDTLISFGLSMIYPIGLNLLPGIFRIPALRAKKKDKKCLYKTSCIIALI